MTKRYMVEKLSWASIPSNGNSMFINCAGSDNRSYKSLELGDSNVGDYASVVFRFAERDVVDSHSYYYKYAELVPDCMVLSCSHNDPQAGIRGLHEVLKRKGIVANHAVVDITAFTKPYLFTLINYLYNNLKLSEVDFIYTEPNNYVFPDFSFDSYTSTVGADLELREIPGFPGIGNHSANTVLITLIGFDGALSAFIYDEMAPTQHYVINGFPSYFPKFKDISLVNNEKIVDALPSVTHMLSAPSNNPFEVFNSLFRIKNGIGSQKVCISPLGSKPMALGACLFGLTTKSARFIYPTPKSYVSGNTYSSWVSWRYNVSFDHLRLIGAAFETQ